VIVLVGVDVELNVGLEALVEVSVGEALYVGVPVRVNVDDWLEVAVNVNVFAAVFV
jgi:hypothetical protein